MKITVDYEECKDCEQSKNCGKLKAMKVVFADAMTIIHNIAADTDNEVQS